MSRVTYKHDYQAFNEAVLSASFMVEEMRTVAFTVADRAVELAAPHFDPTDRDGDHYIDHFRVEAGVRDDHRSRRAYGRVVNDHEAAWSIEWGTVDTPKQRILGRALDAVRE